MRPGFAGEVRPLGEPMVDVFAGFPATKRELLGVGDAIDPDGAYVQEGGEANGEKTGRGAGGDDNIGAFAKHHQGDADGAQKQEVFLSHARVGNRAKARAGLEIGPVTWADGGEGDVAVFESGSKSQKLYPVAAAG